MHAAFQIADAFAMDDAHFENASRAAFFQVRRHQIAQVLRAKRVQIQHAVNRQLMVFTRVFRHAPQENCLKLVELPDSAAGLNPVMKTTRFTRRHFIRSASVAAAAPFILPSAVWSAETPPSERLTLGCIGIGTQGRGLMGGFLGRKDVQVVAVCDVDTNRRENGKKMVEEAYTKQKLTPYKGCTAYNDFRELLARQDINAVVIATPDHWHAPIGVAACKAGKDIYCEKPLTESIHEARALVDAVRKHNRVFQTGSMQRSSKEFRIACELVRNGVIGKVKTVEVNIGGPGVPCDLAEEAAEPGLDWDMWLGPAPKRPYH